MKLTKITTTGTKSTLIVSDSVFAGKVNDVLIAQAIRVYLSNKRQGTSKVKTRSEVIRTKKKWFKQKGTGNARHGARSAGIFVGGGVAHGPKGIENWKLKLSKKMKLLALSSSLSAQAKNTIVCDAIESLDGKTKQGAELMNRIAPDTKKIVVILSKANEKSVRSLRNIETVMIVSARRLNALEVAIADKIILSVGAIKILEERLSTKS